ncbi:MAG: hypothetical protein D6B28_00675 [Gammaproteobacteria bacterium]|nr:MAG: hypothetical protein D6B28_00675 [Gammaproteobacteria bacterium]
MEDKYNKRGEDNTDDVYMDTWESIKAEFNNILQNEFNIKVEDSQDPPQKHTSESDISSTLMKNGIGFTTLQNAVLNSISNDASDDNDRKAPPSQNSIEKQSWNGLASCIIKEHGYLLHNSQSENDCTQILKTEQGRSQSSPTFPTDNYSGILGHFAPYSINVDHFLPFNPANASNIEESIHNLRTNSDDQQLSNWQGEIYNGLSLMNRYYQGYYKLQGTLALAIPRATAIFKQRIANEVHSEDDKFSITDIYYIWLDSCEEAYIFITSSEEFSKNLGELVNTYSNLKIATSGFTENVSTFTGLPTQKDLDSSYHEQYILRKQQHSIKEDLQSIHYQREMDNKVNSAKIESLTSEIEILKQQISQLKGLLDNSNQSEDKGKGTEKKSDNMH